MGDIARVIHAENDIDFGYDVGDMARITKVRPVGTLVEAPLPFLPDFLTEKESYEVEWIANKRANIERVNNMYPHEIELVPS